MRKQKENLGTTIYLWYYYYLTLIHRHTPPVCCLCIRKGGREQDMNVYMYFLILSKGNAGRTGQKLIKMIAN